MAITYHRDLIQGTDEWLAARRGLLTASEMKLIITPTLKVANNEKSRAHVWELLAQRITEYVEPHYIGDEMLRGYDDEIKARALYSKHCHPVEEIGFVTNEKWGFTIGCSPDGLVGDEGLIESKSRRQKFQIETIASNTMPDDYLIQVQTSLLVTERKWLDFISYSGGLPMWVIRVFPNVEIQDAIVNAATAFESALAEKRAQYLARLNPLTKLIPTERTVVQDMYV